MILNDLYKILTNSGFTQVYEGTLPASPDDIIGLFLTGGSEYLPWVDEPTFQVRVRADHYNKGYQTAKQLKELFINLRDYQVETRLYKGFYIVGDILNIGKDANQRDEFTLNFRALVTKKPEYEIALMLVEKTEETKSYDIYNMAYNFMNQYQITDGELRDRLYAIEDLEGSPENEKLETMLIYLELAEGSLDRFVYTTAREYSIFNYIEDAGIITRLDNVLQAIEGKELQEAQEKAQIDAEILSYQQSIQEKNQQITLLQDDILSLENDIDTLNGTVGQLTTEKEALEVQLDEKIGEILLLEAERTALLQQLEDYQGDTQHLEDEIADLENQIALKMTEIESLALEIDGYIAQIAGLNDTITQLEADKAALDAELINKQLIIDDLTLQKADLESQLTALQIAYFELEQLINSSGPDLNNYFGFEPNVDGMTFYLSPLNLVIPGSINMSGVDVPVTELPVNMLNGSIDALRILSVEMQNGIKRIGQSAFMGCSNLEDVIWPTTLQSIGREAFSGCSKLKAVDLYPGVFIDYMAFNNCNGLTEIELPSGVSLGANAFTACSNLVTVKLPNDLTDIPNRIFMNCNNLANVNMPKNLISVGEYAFDRASIVDIDLPHGTTTIGIGAFRYTSLKTIGLPSTITSIGSNAFQYTSLEAVRLGENIPIILNNIASTLNTAYANNNKAAGLYVKVGTAWEYQGPVPGYGLPLEDGDYTGDDFAFEAQTGTIFSYSGTDTDLVIPYSINGVEVEHITDHAFIGWQLSAPLTSVELPSSLKTIGFGAFMGNQLTEITLPDGLTTINGQAFMMNNINNVVIPENVVSLGAEVFGGNPIMTITVDSNNQYFMDYMNGIYTKDGSILISGTALTAENLYPGVSVLGPDSLRTLGLETFTIPNTVQVIEWSALANNLIQSINIPESVNTIRPRAFMGNPLTTITVDQNNIHFMEYMNGIYSTDGTELILATAQSANNLLAGIEKIGDGAMIGLGLQTFTIPNTVQYLGLNAFGQNQLTEVILPNGLLDIGPSAFSDNKLSEIVIPEGVVSIGDMAFFNNELTRVVIPTTVNYIGHNAFGAQFLNWSIESMNEPGEWILNETTFQWEKVEQ